MCRAVRTARRGSFSSEVQPPGAFIVSMFNWFGRRNGVTRPTHRQVRLALESLEGREVLSHGVHTAVAPRVGHTELHAPEIIDAQRGYPVPPSANPKPPEITVRPKPVIVLPPTQPTTTST